MGYLYAYRNVREDTQINLGTLHGLDFAFDDFFCSRELFRGETDTLALDTKAPVSICKCSSFGGSAGGDWNDTRVSLDERNFSRRELMPQPHKRWSAILRRLRPQGGREDGMKERHEIM